MTRSPSLRPIRSLFSPTPTFLPPGSMKMPAEPMAWPFTVTTPDDQWAYAATFARAVATGERYAGPIAVRLLLDVSIGAVGVGCLNASKTDFIDEVHVEPGAAAPLAVDLIVLEAAALGSLIVRNVSSAGKSEVRLYDLQCFALDIEPEETRGPGLSDPRPMPEWNRYYGNHGDTAIEKLRVQAFRALTAPTVLRWVDGLSVGILPGDQLSRALFVSNTYEPNTLCALRRLLHIGDVFLDVGANAGIMSLTASRWVGSEGRVYGFEPSPREHRRLIDNLALNEVANVTPVRAAVSSYTGTARLRVAGAGHGGLNTLGETFAYDGIETVAIELVETTTLDDFIRDQRIDHVSVVKVDVEGAEGAVLTGSRHLLHEHRPALVLEVASRALAANRWSVSAIEDLLRGAAYRLFTIHDETSAFEPVTQLAGRDEFNVVALPEEYQPALKR